MPSHLPEINEKDGVKPFCEMIYSIAISMGPTFFQTSLPPPRFCRMHGAAGGAPKGNRNALKHGASTAETIALRKKIVALARLARETMAAIE